MDESGATGENRRELVHIVQFYSGHKSKSDVLVVVFVVWVLVLGWLGCFT